MKPQHTSELAMVATNNRSNSPPTLDGQCYRRKFEQPVMQITLRCLISSILGYLGTGDPSMRRSISASGNGADPQAAALRQMTADQLRGLGAHQVVYLRAGMGNGTRPLVLYAADGEPLLMVDDIETAAEIAAEHGLRFVSIH
jgi:hypothetical protein